MLATALETVGEDGISQPDGAVWFVLKISKLVKFTKFSTLCYSHRQLKDTQKKTLEVLRRASEGAPDQLIHMA